MKISLLAMSLLAAPVTFAAERLDEILAEMQKAGDELETLSADFEQTDYDAILEDHQVSTGKLYLEVPGRVRWEHVEPAPKVLIVKDKLVRLYNPKGVEGLASRSRGRFMVVSRSIVTKSAIYSRTCTCGTSSTTNHSSFRRASSSAWRSPARS